MKSTLADVKMMFNAKDWTAQTLLPDAIANNEYAILDMDPASAAYGQAIDVNGSTFATLPNFFTIMGYVNGKFYKASEVIEKAKIRNLQLVQYQAPIRNRWETTFECCSCIDVVTLHIGIEEAGMIQEQGLTWTHKDFVVEVQPQELACLCDCNGVHKVYENHVFTNLLYGKVNAMESPYYEAEVWMDLATVASGAALPNGAGEVLGDLYVQNGVGLFVYDGTNWIQVGTTQGLITDVDTLIQFTESVNTDGNPTTNTPLLTLVLLGKIQPTPAYADIDVNYVYPRGVKLNPSIQLGSTCSAEFTETALLGYEYGAGYDLRAEEWETMNNYTDLNYYPRLYDGVQAPGLVYQFENYKNYDVVTFEYFAGKVEANSGEQRLFGVTLGAETGTQVATDLFTAFS